LCNARKDIANLQRVHILGNVASRDLWFLSTKPVPGIDVKFLKR
jgi:hypothetical protein